MTKLSQNHLNRKQQINLGSFYTPKNIVDLTYSLLKKSVNNLSEYVIFDSSCGYGSFLKIENSKRLVGSDIDEEALFEAKKMNKNVEFFKTNSLQNVSRNNYSIKDEEKLIMIGNPPYNDMTSMIRQSIKKNESTLIDKDIKTRDLGMSFLLSYNKLKTDFVCVLHPLSYLVKKTNFNALKNFTKNYTLINGVIISSSEFSDTSKETSFPILIALYKRNNEGMNFEYIKKYKFKTKEGHTFCLNDYDTISNYISKYPNKKTLQKDESPVARFYTMRDINALKRNRTFIDKDIANTVYVTQDKLPYYCYVDVFKKYAEMLPYYFGNCDILINESEFIKIKECFVSESIHSNPVLKKYLNYKPVPNAASKIEKYFKNFLGGHLSATNNNRQ